MELLQKLLEKYENELINEDIQIMRNIWKCKIDTIKECINILKKG